MADTLEKRQNFVQGLRDLADLFERESELPLPTSKISIDIWPSHIDSETPVVEQFAKYARLLAPVTKETVGGDYFILRRKFGDFVRIDVTSAREKVCTKRVVRVEHVEAELRPAELIPAHDREIVEWDCPKLLAPEDDVVEVS
jgi:hypothetical protein